MTPHDKELMLYNAIILRLEQATEQMYQLLSWDEGMMVNKEMRDSIVLAGVYLRDAQDKFKRYVGLKKLEGNEDFYLDFYKQAQETIINKIKE